MKTALTIAGSDPTGGAGLQADLRTFHAFGVYGYSLPSTLTAQSTTGIERVEPVAGDFFARQADCLLGDVRPDALKTGLLFSSYVVEYVAGIVGDRRLPNLVIDPVTVSSTGVSMLEAGALDTLRDRLFPLARVITPNIYEAAVLTGMVVETEEDMERAARELLRMGPRCVILTGGHLAGFTLDLFADGSEVLRFRDEKIAGEHHGTGCVFSAAVTALLAKGTEPGEAARQAKKFIQEAIAKAFHPGRGMGLLSI